MPELSDLRQNVGTLGGALKILESVGQYTSHLFDMGVVPMRMEAYAERDKFNRMLQTSMYGGLSSSIQKGLRDYLLAEDPSLRNHVARMRENLEACRVTRQEIALAGQKYKTIQGVFKSGYGMFEAAFHGTRIRVVGLGKNADASRADHLRCKSQLVRTQSQRRDLDRRHAELKIELEFRQREYSDAEALWSRCKQARKIAIEIERHTPMRLEAKEELERVEGRLRNLEQGFRECEWKRDRLLNEKEQSAVGMADAQNAWEQVSRKVALCKQANEALNDARKAFPDREVTDLIAADLLSECRDQWKRALESKTQVERELESVVARVSRYGDVLEALRQASQKDLAPEHALETARELDREFREMVHSVKEAEALPERMEEAKNLAASQQEVRRRLNLLDGKGEQIESATDLRSLFESRQKEQDGLAEERRTRRRIEEIDLRLKHCREVLRELTQCLPDASLLDDSDWGEICKKLQRERREVGALKERMETLQPAVERVLAGWLDLEYPPPGPELVHLRKQAMDRAEAVLDYWSKGRDLLGTLVDRLPYLSYADPEKLLVEQESALEALKMQMGKLDQEPQAAKEEVEGVGKNLAQARKAFNKADAFYEVLNEKVESLRQDLARTGEGGSLQSLDDSQRSKEEAKKKLDAAQKAEREIYGDLIRAGKDVEIGENNTAAARERRKGDIEALWPHWRNWMSLKRRAMREALADRLLNPQVVHSYDQKGPPRAFEEASGHQGELKRILQSVPQGGNLWQEVERLGEPQNAETRRGSQTLDAWLMIRGFLEKSIPRDIAQADDPEVALKQIEDHLRRLDGRLVDQERQLRQRSDTIANSIRTRIRREERQIHRINKGLEAISFGTIASIRIRLERVEAMQRLLDGLKVQKGSFRSQCFVGRSHGRALPAGGRRAGPGRSAPRLPGIRAYERRDPEARIGKMDQGHVECSVHRRIHRRWSVRAHGHPGRVGAPGRAAARQKRRRESPFSLSGRGCPLEPALPGHHGRALRAYGPAASCCRARCRSGQTGDGLPPGTANR